MGKRLLLPTFATLMLLAGAAGAVDLRDAALRSGSGEALDAIIRLSETEGLTADQIDIRVADADDYARFELERESVLDTLELTLDLDNSSGPVLLLTTPVAIEQPFLSLVLDTRWPSGRTLTEYTLRLQSAAFSAQSAPNRIEPTRSESLPLSVADDESTEAPAATLAVSAAATEAVTDSSAAARSESTGTPDNASRVTVVAGDTLWEIALQVRPDRSVSVQQTMLALQRLNPEAFIGGNINQVRRGAVLRVPEIAEIRQLDSAAAIAEVARQNQALTLGLRQPAADSQSSASAQGELRVVAVEDNEDQQPDASAAGSQAAERERRLNELEDRLAVRQEEIDRLERTNEELNARLAMLQEQVAASQEIIRLRDLELAQLQQSLAEQANERPEPPPPPVVTMAPEGGPMARIASTLMNNTWALLGTILALIVLVVLVLAARNRAAKAREQDAAPPAEDPDALLFADVAQAADETPDNEDVPVAGFASVLNEEDDEEADDDTVSSDEFDDELDEELDDELESIWEDEGGRPDDQDPEDGPAGEPEGPTFYDDFTDLDDIASDEPQSGVDEDPIVELSQAVAGTAAIGAAGSTVADPDAERAPTTEELIEALDATSAPREPLDPEDDFSLDTSFELDEAIPLDSGEPREHGRDDELDSELDWPAEELDELDAAGVTLPPAVDETASESASGSTGAPATGVDDFDDLAFTDLDDILAGDDDTDDGDSDAFGLGPDETATKLDLARAYIDMGDAPGAREILEEVLQEGTGEQRDEASKLLERL